ncbi:MAG: PQQ-binding-like beta-propeller repeat protein [Acidobacteria bacterium]|nr:PQQ-binding-like beta-propeller repeat protein [Acidobacteriota bacterium]
MKQEAKIATAVAVAGTALLACGTGSVGDWPMYRGDAEGTGYSALSEITTANVADLAQAWSYSLASVPTSVAGGPLQIHPARSQATPIVVGGLMYVPSADSVVALDPATGDTVWSFGLLGSGTSLSRRGVAYWPGGGTESRAPRILFTAGARLIALDAATGVPTVEFGSRRGTVDIGVPYNSVPLVWEDIVVVGANTPPGAPGGIGNARAYSVVTGEKLWEFNSVPQPGHVGHDTWAGHSWRGRLGANAWPFYFTVDDERELVFLPLASPIPFAYGGDRHGSNLFANSVVAVELRTGEYRWHFQTIHHDLWDHDPPAPPVLFEVERGGETIDALAVTTKSGYLFILNRETGEPVFGVEERQMPPSGVPGEQAHPTQPIPTTPALGRVGFEPGDLVTAEDTTPEHAAACAELVGSAGPLHNRGPYTPWMHRGEGESGATLLFPGLAGGPNWGGVAFDPATRRLLAFSQDVGTMGWLEEDPEAEAGTYVLRVARPFSFAVRIDGQSWPCQKPPWGRLTAVDADTGEIAWQRPVGVTKGLPPGKQETGRPGRASAIVTAGGLAFIAATDDRRFRALDVATGEELWSAELPRQGNANPMTYLGTDGRQYVAVTATEEVVAFRLP